LFFKTKIKTTKIIQCFGFSNILSFTMRIIIMYCIIIVWCAINESPCTIYYYVIRTGVYGEKISIYIICNACVCFWESLERPFNRSTSVLSPLHLPTTHYLIIYIYNNKRARRFNNGAILSYIHEHTIYTFD